MGLRVCDLPSVRWRKVRVFELNSRADLEHRKRINLRDTYEPATIARRIGVRLRDLKSIGITEKDINIRKLGRALDAGVVVPSLNLRAGEAKDPDLLLRVIAGRLGREDETLDFDIYRAMESITDEKARIQLASNYFRAVSEGRDLPSCANLLFTIGRLCHPERPADQKYFIISVFKANYGYSTFEDDKAFTAGELTVLTARLIYPEDIPAQVIMIGNAAQVIYNKRGYEEPGKFLGSASRSLYPKDLPAQSRVVLAAIPTLPRDYSKLLNAEILVGGLLDGLALTDSPERDNFVADLTRKIFPRLSDSQAVFVRHLAEQLYRPEGPSALIDRNHFVAKIASLLYPDDNGRRDCFLSMTEE